MRLKKKYKIILYVTFTMVLGWLLTVSGISAFKYLRMVEAYNFVVDGEVKYTIPAEQHDDLELLLSKYKLHYLSIA